MSDYSGSDPVQVEWGGPYQKEKKLREMTEDAARTREATEELAQQTARQTAMVADGLRRQVAEQQIAWARDTLRKGMLEDLFFRCQYQPTLVNNCNGFIDFLHRQPSNEAIPPEIASKLLEFTDSLREHVSSVFEVDSTDLTDFSQKKALQDLRSELLPLIDRWNKSLCEPVRRRLTPQIIAERYAAAKKFNKAEIDNYLLRAGEREVVVKTHNNSVNARSQSTSTFVQCSGWVLAVLGLAAVLIGFVSGNEGYLALLACVGFSGGVVAFLGIKSLAEDQLSRFVASSEARCHAIGQRLSAIHPLAEVGSLVTVQHEMAWQGDAWVLNERGKMAVSQGIDKLWRVSSKP